VEVSEVNERYLFEKVFRYTLQNYGIVLDDGERVLLENFEKREISIRLE